MEFDFTNPSTLKEAAKAIRTHNHIHNRAERNAVLITEYLSFAADLIDKLADGDVVIARRGRWIPQEDSDCDVPFVCSKCNRRLRWDENFCPNCCADMREL